MIPEINEPAVAPTENGQVTPVDISASTDETKSIELTKIKVVAQAKLDEITNMATQVLAIKTKLEDYQTVVATKSAHIEDAQKHGDKVRGDLDRELTTAKQQATDAESQKTRAQMAADDSVRILGDIQATKGAVKTDAEAVVAALKGAEESAAKTKTLADKSATIETRVADYEKHLADLGEQASAQLKTIERLLPGAASAGLASSFGERRQTFFAPQRKWEHLFIGSLAAVFILATYGFIQMHLMTTPTWDAILAFWLMRIPLALPLIWLAIHASREVALAKRLEEDYGYKAAMSACFEGFRRQMSEIPGDDRREHPLAKLCDNTLTIIASPPGRIYEKHKLTATPADHIAEIVEGVKETITPKPS